jgi:hypothetical protein
MGNLGAQVRKALPLTLPRLRYRPLESRRQKIVAGLAGVLAFLALTLLAGPRLTGGRIGLVAVEGDSMCDRLPWGTCVLVAPGRLEEGDLVVAWAPDYGEGGLDRGPSLVVKEWREGKLYSTGTGDILDKFELRGKVVCVLPVQRLLPWRQGQTSLRGEEKLVSQLQRRSLDRQCDTLRLWVSRMTGIRRYARHADPVAMGLHGYEYAPRKGLVYSELPEGRVVFVLGRKPVKLAAVVVHVSVCSALTQLKVGDREYNIVTPAGVPKVLEFKPPAEVTKVELVRNEVPRGTPRLSAASCIRSVHFWVAD